MDNKLTLMTSVAMLVFGAVACSRDISFTQDIEPIIAKRCLECHQTGQAGFLASGLNMESHAALLKGTRFGAVIIPGSSASSTLVRLIEHKADPSINMPHGGREALTSAEIERIKTWIDQGAKNN